MKKINLSNRLLKCVEMIDYGSAIADIGTDHAYIPIHLALQKQIPHALACDINPGPLENAKSNIKNYNLEKIIETRLSDGLQNISENEAQEIIIAGMGGNMIANILNNCIWENKHSKKFILQPMKYENNLRIFLSQKGYEIEQEQAVICSGKVYTVMRVSFSGIPYILTPEEEYIGKICKIINADSIAYIKKQIKNLMNIKKGAQAQKLSSQEKYYSSIIQNLKEIVKINFKKDDSFGKNTGNI